jgi:hypothetical protein
MGISCSVLMGSVLSSGWRVQRSSGGDDRGGGKASGR